MTTWDTFMFADELDMLECRLVELEDVPDLVHVAVEADVDHQGHPKPYHLSEQAARFVRWADRLVIVRATGLPESDNPWDREHAQREWAAEALQQFDAEPDDVVLHGDVDEIPTATFARHVRPQGKPVAAGQRFHPWAVDWLHPHVWQGTVATRARDVTSYAALRDQRRRVQVIPGSGWHFSWVGGHEQTVAKLDTFCHLEILDWVGAPIHDGDLYRHGYHVDGTRLEAVDVDHTWPKWVTQGRCPDAWFRPRDVERRRLDIRPGQIVAPVAS